jgi:chromosome segregation ATPase
MSDAPVQDPPRKPPVKVGRPQTGRILNALKSLDDKVDVIGDRVARVEGQLNAQTSSSDKIEKRLVALENDKIDCTRVGSLENTVREHNTRLIALEKGESRTVAVLDQISKDLAELKDDMKPVKKFVDRSKLFLLAVTGTGGVVGAIVTAIVLKALHLA